jgi:transcriptional antiterminator NusG|tara:strand:- start:1985 stop:2584 length:600 start_codon:yes stop_codon:yes gene_type:complete
MVIESFVSEESDSTGSDGEVEVSAGSWFIVQTYSGHEANVKQHIQQAIQTLDLGDRIFDVFIPTVEEIQIKAGQRKTVTHKKFPGYVFIRMLLDDDTWRAVKNVPSVSGFAASNSETGRPLPMPDEEVEQLIKEDELGQATFNIGFAVGESVLVIDGPFSDMLGEVDSIDIDRGRVRVMVSMFGRETPVDLDFLQVEKQ